MPRWGETGRWRRCLARMSWPWVGVRVVVSMGLHEGEGEASWISFLCRGRAMAGRVAAAELTEPGWWKCARPGPTGAWSGGRRLERERGIGLVRTVCHD